MQAYIPSTWAMSNIGAIADVVAGGTPKADDKSNFSAPGTGFAWLTPADLSGYMEKYISHGSRDLSEKGLATSSAKLMPAGTLLFSSRAPIGYVAIAANEISTNQGFKNFVFTNKIVPTYAYFYLKSIRGLAESLGTGTTFKEISGGTAKTLPFVIPPFAEQKEIANRLDILLAQVEATQARLARIPDIIKRFRQSVLAAALSGKLTEKWRNINNVKIQEWSSKALADIASVIDPNPSHRYPEPEAQGVPILSTQQFIGDSGWTKEKSKLVSKSFHSERMGKCGFFEGDIVFARKGRLGLARFSPSGFDYVYSHTLFIVRAKKEVYPKFLLWSLRPNSVVEHLLTEMNSNTGVPTLGKSVFERMKICLPSYIEQTEIVHRVEQLFAYADTIEQQAKAAKERVDKLTQAILAKAFRGELTADWRAANPELISGDNSAAALLARIQAERATAKPRKRASKPAISPTSSGVPQ
ncbi:TPA: restriction endonuclease subunit S [Aeromonas hydrophila]